MTKETAIEETAFSFPINIQKTHLKLQKKERNNIITLFFGESKILISLLSCLIHLQKE